MPIDIAHGGNRLTVTIHGELTHPEFVQMQKDCTAILRDMGRKGILVNAADFQGWAKGGNWADLSFQISDSLIEKMAIVIDPAWQDLAALFTGQGMRKFPIEIFIPADHDRALKWLGSSTAM